MAERISRDESLDGLRGFAALYVVFFHISVNHPQFSQYSEIFRSIAQAGADMVAVFFVLSGYFIAVSATHLSSTHPSPTRAFMIRRFFRIMPVWVLLLTYMLFMYQIKIEVYFANLFFYFGNLGHFQNKWLPVIPAWTLQSEVIFYVIAAIFLKQIARLKPTWGLVLWLMSLGVLELWQNFIVEYFKWSEHFGHHFFFSQAHYFVAGVLISKIKYKNNFDIYLPKKIILFLEVLIGGLLLVRHHSELPKVPLFLLAPGFVWLLTFKESYLRRLFKNKLFLQMGSASFSIYILQSQCHGFISYNFPNLEFTPNIFINLTFAVLVGFVVYYLIEKPIIRWSKRF